MERFPSDYEEEEMMVGCVPIPLDYLEMFQGLSDADFGKLMRWCLTYYKTQEDSVELPGEITALKMVCKTNMDHALDAYNSRCDANRENGKKGGRPRKTPENQENPNNPNNPNNPMGFRFSQEGRESGEKALSLEERERSKEKEDTHSLKEGKERPRTRECDHTKERFDRFWKAYPKKVGKQAAYKTWSKINPSGDLTEEIIRAVEKQKTWRQWQRDNGQYIPNPTTWLNQGRWEDEGYGGDQSDRNSKTWSNLGGDQIGTGSF